MMAGVELMADPTERRPMPAELRAGHQVADAARERGLIVRPIGNVVIFMPPLAVRLEELDAMLDILLEAFEVTLPRLSEHIGEG